MNSFDEDQMRFLELLSSSFPNIKAASSEIINLSAILQLPKSTEHFISDIHGEYEYFTHILKNASGSVHRKIDECLGGELSEEERNRLAVLIYYPTRELADLKASGCDTLDWYEHILYQLIMVCRSVTSKYTRSKVRKALPADFAYILEELISTNQEEANKQDYFQNIITTIIEIGIADDFIVAVSEFINRMVVDKLHILGDIFDRGDGAHMIMDDLSRHHNVDYVWGNHDILWMGASLGNPACVCTVIRNAIRYNNFDTVEDGYGINVRPLAVFAMEQYADDPCPVFMPKHLDSSVIDDDLLTAKIHKAIAIIQFKVEGQLILRHPEYGMSDRLLLDKMDMEGGTVTLGGKKYELLDKSFPTIDPQSPYELTRPEELLLQQLRLSFQHSRKLKEHVAELYKRGGMYKIYNNNLMFHGCVPMNDDGSFTELKFSSGSYSGRALFDSCDRLCRAAAFGERSDQTTKDGLDYMWYLWCGPKSPLNGRRRMTTFERYFVADRSAWAEEKDNYYRFTDDVLAAQRILAEFGVDPARGHIINGHMPVRINKGESPIKASGKVLIIDGGLSKAYQPVTGIGGYTLVFNSHQLYLAEHQPFDTERAFSSNTDMQSRIVPVQTYYIRLRIKDTDEGKVIQKKIEELRMLLSAYRQGAIKQKG